MNDPLQDTFKVIIESTASIVEYITIVEGKLEEAINLLNYILKETQKNPMLFRLFNPETLNAIIKFVKENTNEQ